MANEKSVGTVSCPYCKHAQPIEIPLTKCLLFYKCNNCKAVVRAKKTCCVFCDYGDRKCPAAEQHRKE